MQLFTHLNIPQYLFLLLFLVAITLTGREESLWIQNFMSSFLNFELKIKTIPNKNPKNHSFTAFFPKHNWINEIPARQNDKTLKNRSNSPIFHDHKLPTMQIKNNANHTDSFFLALHFPVILLLPPPTRRLRVLISLRAISPAMELKGSGKILRLNATAEASWRIVRLDAWDQSRLLTHAIVRDGWNCEKRNEIGLRMWELKRIEEIENGWGWSEIEKEPWVLQM